MNILYIINTQLQNLTSGSGQRTYLLYNSLRELGEVYVLEIASDFRKINDLYYCSPIIPQKGIKRIINSIWCRGINLICKKLVFYYLPFANKIDINKIYHNIKFDAVVVRYLNNIGHLHCWLYGPLYVDVDDYPLEVFDTSIAQKNNNIRNFIARNIQKLFVWLCLRKVKGAWIANPEQYEKISFIKKSEILKNLPILDNNYIYKATSGFEKYIFTVGLMSYEPNYYGVDSFLTNIWPKVREKFPELEYLIIGKGIPIELTKKWFRISGVRILGFVDDLEAIYINSLATVVPINSGGGTCIKTLESLAHGRICFSTLFGARGIISETINNNSLGLFIFNNEREFINYLEKIVSNSIFRNSCEKANMNFIRKYYSFNMFKSNVRQVIV